MKEITTQEMEKISGGLPPLLLTVFGGVLIAAGAHVINNWDDFKAGLAGQPRP